eukprot:m.379873 g.379873  ORF g.379873 m.379873 type:complete len:53 (+) comp100770_c0_seq1:91-249(+)
MTQHCMAQNHRNEIKWLVLPSCNWAITQRVRSVVFVGMYAHSFNVDCSLNLS